MRIAMSWVIFHISHYEFVIIDNWDCTMIYLFENCEIYMYMVLN